MNKPSLSVGIVLAAAVLACAGTAGAATRQSQAQALYQQERAACMRGDTNQDRATCLKEANAAYQEARRGGLSASGDGDLGQNRTERCQALPRRDRKDCEMRMQGQGVTSGSAQQGGVLRELSRPVAPRSN